MGKLLCLIFPRAAILGQWINYFREKCGRQWCSSKICYCNIVQLGAGFEILVVRAPGTTKKVAEQPKILMHVHP